MAPQFEGSQPSERVVRQAAPSRRQQPQRRRRAPPQRRAPPNAPSNKGFFGQPAPVSTVENVNENVVRSGFEKKDPAGGRRRLPPPTRNRAVPQRPKRRAHRGRPTEPKRKPQASMKEPQNPLREWETTLKCIDGRLVNLAENCSDPFEFEFEINELTVNLQKMRDGLHVPKEYSSICKEVEELQESEQVVGERMEDFELKKRELKQEIIISEQEVNALRAQLRQKEINLKAKQNSLDDLSQIQNDCISEKYEIQEALKIKLNLKNNLENSIQITNQCKDLISHTESQLEDVKSQANVVEERFQSTWRVWSIEQIINWLCGLDEQFETLYRTKLEQSAPQQLENGEDFEIFDANVLLGLGVEKLRHRLVMMNAISSLTAGHFGEEGQ